MSEATASQEPSMEEILASIRRIISEEGQEQPGGDALSPVKPAAAMPPAPPPPVPPRPVMQEAPAPVLVQDDEDEDELVLTEVVTNTADLGQNNVVPLKPEAKVEPKIDIPEDKAAFEDDIELAMDEPPMMPPPPEKPAAQGQAGTLVEPSGFDDDDFAAVPAAPMPKTAAPKPAAKPAMDEFERMTEELPDLVAPEVADAATASFAQLLNRRSPEVPDRPTGDGLLVETLVRQAVEPLLKAWLDAHLEPIVEKIVRREVERMARKAELG
jgi:cell pole-organizing protein PopZ